jgi:outer membrane protein, heavy metal efflux system
MKIRMRACALRFNACSRFVIRGVCSGSIAAVLTVYPAAARAQNAAETITLDSLVARAIAANPDLAAAQSRAAAMRARIAPAGARPDPMLMAGLVNVPVNNFSLTADDMTMKMIGVSQTIPYPGKLRLARRVAELEAGEQSIVTDSVRLAVIRDVKTAYYEIAYIDAALATANRTDSLASTVIKAANLRYSAGRGAQQDVLRFTLEATRLNDSANELIERRRALVERIAALTGGAAPLLKYVTIPSRLMRAAVDANPSTIRFLSQTLGAPVADGHLLPLDQLQALAVMQSPQIRRQIVMNTIATTQLELARREHLPDVDFSLQYGQRSGTITGADNRSVSRPDMVSFVVSLPIPLQREAKQSALVRAAEADVVTGASERRASEALVRSEVARLYSDVSRAKTQLALYVKALVPQGRASLTASVNAYQSGTGDLTAVLEAQRTLLDMEVGYDRSLTDFAQKIAELDSMIGQEALR